MRSLIIWLFKIAKILITFLLKDKNVRIFREVVIAMDLDYAVLVVGVREQQEIRVEELYYKICIYIYIYL